MSGKRLLDLAALFNASRGVTQKHVALRSQQLDAYSRTSTLARAVQNQTGRLTETVKAAAVLASRLNEGPPKWMDEDAGGKTATEDARQNYATGSAGPAKSDYSDRIKAASERLAGTKEGTQAETDGELEVKQAEAVTDPLPDGTIPPTTGEIKSKLEANESAAKEAQEHSPSTSQGKTEFKAAPWASTIHYKRQMSATQRREAQREAEHQIPSQAADYDGYKDPLEEGHDEDSFYHKSQHVSPDLSSLPRVKIPKHISDVQETDDHIAVQGMNSDSYSDNIEHTHAKPITQAVPEQEVPDGINTDIFHSPRVAKILGGKTHMDSSKPGFEPKHAEGTPIDRTKLSEGIDQETFNVRSSSQKEPTFPPKVVESETANSESSQDVNKGEVEALAEQIAAESASSDKIAPAAAAAPYELRESRVPSSRFGRLWNYGGLAAGMFGGAITESLKRATGAGGEGSYMLSAGNMDRLVTKLSRMRGAALKLGQMISFQDSKMLPAAVQEVLQRVQDRADYMPASQRDKVLASNLGPEWRELFSSFDEKPLAAASIGQVHSAVLKSNGQKVAVKVQYPGVADSIDSDLSNLTLLLTASRLLPKGLFLDKTIANARTELGWECDYIREAEAAAKFQTLLADDTDTFVVPKVYAEASGKQVLTMEFMEGVGVTRVQSFTQEQRDWIGTQILRLCLREITEFKYMQTDPNWTNFLYNAQTNKLELLDFGASREYPAEFIDTYSRLLAASSISDKTTIRDLSIKLGYLTGHESKAMLDAHIQSVMTLAEPFLDNSPEVYDFKDQTITERVKALIPVMIRERLAPPPEETYSLHRKLSGAFLLCAKLGSRVRCRELFQNSMTKAGIL